MVLVLIACLRIVGADENAAAGDDRARVRFAAEIRLPFDVFFLARFDVPFDRHIPVNEVDHVARGSAAEKGPTTGHFEAVARLLCRGLSGKPEGQTENAEAANHSNTRNEAPGSGTPTPGYPTWRQSRTTSNSWPNTARRWPPRPCRAWSAPYRPWR